MDVKVVASKENYDTARLAGKALSKILEYVYADKAEYIKEVVVYDYEEMRRTRGIPGEFIAYYDVKSRSLHILPLFDEYVTAIWAVAITLYPILSSTDYIFKYDNVYQALYACKDEFKDVLEKQAALTGRKLEDLEEQYVNALSDTAMNIISIRGAEMTIHAPIPSKMIVENELRDMILRDLSRYGAQNLFPIVQMCGLATVEVAKLLSKAGIRMALDIEMILEDEEIGALRALAKHNTGLAEEIVKEMAKRTTYMQSIKALYTSLSR